MAITYLTCYVFTLNLVGKRLLYLRVSTLPTVETFLVAAIALNKFSSELLKFHFILNTIEALTTEFGRYLDGNAIKFNDQDRSDT